MSTQAGSTPPAPASPAAGTNPTVGLAPGALPVVLKVSFTLNTPDGLRQINFGLEKDSDGTKVNWTITFTLFERANTTTAFGDAIVSLNVFVATAMHAKAETAAHQGLNPTQTGHATGPAADAAKAAHDGIITLPVANNSIQNTLK